MSEFIKNSVEFQNWGWNALAIGSLGTAVFTLIEGWGLWKQNDAIWEGESGESVSVIWFSYLLFAFVAFFFYGVHIRGLAAMFNGAALALLHVPILLGLRKHKGFTTSEKVQFFLFALMVPAMAFLPWKDEVFMVVSVGIIYSTATQPWELLRAKKSGVLEIRLIVIYLISTIFWVIYAFAISEWVLEILTSANLLLFIITAVLWSEYRSREKAWERGDPRDFHI